MTFRVKATLFAALAVGRTALMSGAPFELAQQGQHFIQPWMHWPKTIVTGATQEVQGALMDCALDALVRFNQSFGALTPLLGVVLVLVLGSAVLLPMRRSLQKLNQTAAELRDSALAKEQQAKLEAQALERELHRHNAQLEETVRMRTTELESANTQLKTSLQRLKAVQDQLLFAERLATIGQIAAGIGHEINNPLAYILSNLNYAQEELRRTKGALSEKEYQEVQAALAETRDGAERVRLIVQDFKLMVSPDNIDRGPMALAPVVRTALKLAEHEIRNRAQVEEQLDNIPLIYGNAPRLGQVFLNLLINAAHAIAPGQVERNTIKIIAHVSGSDYVVVEVSDTGCGIPAENAKRIFDPFFTTKPLGKGSGLGLPVCNSIITAHCGEISFESEVGKGSTFRIILPLYRGKHLPTPPPVALLNNARTGP